MERVLVLSDDGPWRNTLVAELSAAGHQAHALASVQLEELQTSKPAPNTAVLLDLRSENTLTAAIGRVHRVLDGCKVYLLAALSPSQLHRLDFAAAFDDFLVDPFTTAQVVARTRQLRWRQNSPDTEDLLKAGDLLINLASCEVTLMGVPLALTYQEYALLRHLVEHRGRVFSREQLLSELWGYNYYGGTRTVDVHVRRLRAKLGPDNEDLIQTVRNVGYRFARDN